MKWKNNISEFKDPTEQELEINRRYIAECQRLGIPAGKFDGDDF